MVTVSARLRLTLAFLGLATTLVAQAQSPFVSSTPYADGEVLVGYKASTQMHMDGVGNNSPAVDQYDLAVETSNRVGQLAGWEPKLGIGRIRLAPGFSTWAAMSYLKSQPGVAFVEPNYVQKAIAFVPNDPLFADSEYGPVVAKAVDAWSSYAPKKKIVLAIVDTGVEWTHPDLANRIYKLNGKVVGVDLANNDTDPMDDHGHGTHCAGIADAEVNNNEGVAGVAGYVPAGSTGSVSIMPVKVLKNDGSGFTSTVADGVTWATDHGANVISLSLGSSEYTDTLYRAVQYAWSKGCLVVAAAGNDGSTAQFYPGAMKNVVSVAATDRSDELAGFSNYGPWVQVAAPGSGILSTMLGDDYAWMSGTSMATPFVAGEAAMVWAQAPGLSNQQLSNILKQATDPLANKDSRQIASGSGRVNVLKALQAGVLTEPSVLTSLDMDSKVVGGNSLSASVTLNKPAPSGGVTVNLLSSLNSVKLPSTVVIPAGQSTAQFSLKTGYFGITQRAQITATAGKRSYTANLDVVPLQPVSWTLPASVPSSSSFTGQVKLNGSVVGRTISLWLRSDSQMVVMPTNVTVPSGASSVTVTFRTRKTSSSSSSTVTASLNGGFAKSTITVTP